MYDIFISGFTDEKAGTLLCNESVGIHACLSKLHGESSVQMIIIMIMMIIIMTMIMIIMTMIMIISIFKRLKLMRLDVSCFLLLKYVAVLYEPSLESSRHLENRAGLKFSANFKGVLHLLPNISMFVLYLKIINTFLKNSKCIL